MKLTGLHVLLTYKCTYECDHCFVWGSPQQAGVFTLAQLEDAFQQAASLGSVDTFYFEGGETFIYYPILIKAVERAHSLGFTTGIVTNGYWANNVTDSMAWLRPLVEAGLDKIEISYDQYHGDAHGANAAHPGLLAAGRYGLTASTISIDPPVRLRDPQESTPGEPLVGGDVMFRGRAAELLTGDLPRQPWDTFNRCPYENLRDPGRLHLDPFGNLHLCQGIVLGNIWQQSLTELIGAFDPDTHPITGPLLAGGPAQLARHHNLDHESGYVDACHFCYTARKALRPRFPQLLAPDQMYGVA